MKDFSREEKIYISLAFIVGVLYALTVSQVDCNTITMWGYDLLTSLFGGELNHFPQYTFDVHTVPTNYSLFDNTITAFFLLPVFIVERLFMSGNVINPLVYILWYKIILFIIHIVDVIIFYNLLGEIKLDRENKTRGIYYYMLSAVVCLCVIGKGQVDIYTVTFVMLGALCFLRKKYIWMSVFLGLSLLIKPFAILVVVPFYLLSISKLKGKLILYSLITVAPYIADFIITKLLMPEYAYYKNINALMYKEALGSTRVEELFNIHINSVYVYFGLVIVVCFLAFITGKNKRVSIKDYLLYPVILYIMYGIFVSPSCYWFITIVPAIIIMGLKIRHTEDFELLYFGNNLGVIIYIFFTERFLRPGVSFSLLDIFGMKNSESLIYDTFSEYRTIVYGIGATLFLVCMLLVCVVYFFENTKFFEKEKIIQERNKVYCKICFYLQFVPVVLYLIINFATTRWK